MSAIDQESPDSHLWLVRTKRSRLLEDDCLQESISDGSHRRRIPDTADRYNFFSSLPIGYMKETEVTMLAMNNSDQNMEHLHHERILAYSRVPLGMTHDLLIKHLPANEQTFRKMERYIGTKTRRPL
jgi:hypothetical protein